MVPKKKLQFLKFKFKQTIKFRHGGLIPEEVMVIEPVIENKNPQEWAYQLSLPESLSFEEYVSVDEDLETSSPMTDEEIVYSVQNKEDIESEPEEEPDEIDLTPASLVGVVNSIETILSFFAV